MSCLHEFSLRMHTLVSNHALRGASVPYPGVRPRKRGRLAHALLACAAGLRRHLFPCERGEPAAVPYPGVRPCKRGRPAAVPYAGLRRPATCCTGLFERGGFLARK